MLHVKCIAAVFAYIEGLLSSRVYIQFLLRPKFAYFRIMLYLCSVIERGER